MRNYGKRDPKELFDVYCFAKELDGTQTHTHIHAHTNTHKRRYKTASRALTAFGWFASYSATTLKG